ncbi:MAG: hypothetical protein S0880_29035 [Actinomycetota bacterium]|nr:hypothetical protein [Actinomycetota bacterium]
MNEPARPGHPDGEGADAADTDDLVARARALARVAAENDSLRVEVSSAGDEMVAALKARAAVDAVPTVGRFRRLKGLVLRVARLFLRDQATFNRATTTAFEDVFAQLEGLAARLDRVEASLEELRPGPGR